MMDTCSCVYIDVDKGPDFYSERMPIARKSHKCGECGRDILPGEKYECFSGCWDRIFNTHKTCSDCLSIRKTFFCYGCCFGMMLEFLHEHIRDFGGEISSDCIIPLTKAARDKVCDMIEAMWED